MHLKIIFFRSVYISTLFHLAELHLGTLGVICEVLDLLLMGLVVLQLMHCLFELIDGICLGIQLLLHDLIFIFETLDLRLERGDQLLIQNILGLLVATAQRVLVVLLGGIGT